MTTQEFVKKEAATKYPLTTGQPAEADSWNEAFNEVFSDGLTKGLEIAKEFAEWLPDNRWRHTIAKAISQTTSELLTIFLTEKYGNNG